MKQRKTSTPEGRHRVYVTVLRGTDAEIAEQARARAEQKGWTNAVLGHVQQYSGDWWIAVMEVDTPRRGEQA